MASHKSTKKKTRNTVEMVLSLPHADITSVGLSLLNHLALSLSLSLSVYLNVHMFARCIYMCFLVSGSIWQNACWIFVTYTLTLDFCWLHIKWTAVIWACTIAPISHTLFICNSMFRMCKHICGCCYATTSSSSSFICSYQRPT